MTAMAVDVDRLWLSLRTTGAEGVCRAAHTARWDDAEPEPCIDCTSITGDVITALLVSPRFHIGWAEEPEPFVQPLRVAENVAPDADEQPPVDTQPKTGSQGGPENGPPRPRGSAKVAAVRRGWADIVAQREYVPSLKANVELGTATRTQVLEMSQYRAAHARHSAALAEQFEAIADAMKALNAVTVADLPEDLITRTFNPGSKE